MTKHLVPEGGLDPQREVRFSRLGRVDLIHSSVAVLITAVLGVLPLLFDRRFYFNDDTEIGAYGLWYRLSTALADGRLPLIEPSTWMAGNVLVEGQWGVFNPLIWLVGFGAGVAPNVVVYSSLVKIAALCVMSSGVYVLARSFGASPVLATIAGVAVAGNGFTAYLDSPSWVTGLFTTALIPWAWWSIRRYAFTDVGVWASFVACWLVATVGYPHGVLALIGVFCVVLLECALLGGRSRLVRVLVAGALAGAVALAVFIPSVLSVGVTARESGIVNNGFLNGNLSGIASSLIPVAQPEVGGWWGANPPVPMMYVSWILPLVAFIDWRRLALLTQALVSIAVFGLMWLAFVSAPSFFGPFRIPIRMMPYVALAMVLVVVVALSRAMVIRSSHNWRVLLAVGMTLYSAWFAFAEVPDRARDQFVSMLVVVTGVLALAWVLHRSSTWSARRASAMTLGVFTAVTALLTVQQHVVFPSSPLASFGLPSARDAYNAPLEGIEGSVFVVGEPTSAGSPEVWGETLLANTWFLNDAKVANVYTPVGFDAYSERLCMNNRGETCAQALDALFSPVGDGELMLVDAMQINSIQIITPPVDRDTALSPRPGWSVVSEETFSVTWVRENPVELPGGVVMTSSGVELSGVESSESTVAFKVEAVAESGQSTVTFSRLAWPGYTTSAGQLTDPLDGMLLTLDLQGVQAGEVVEVSFAPPGWGAVRLLLVGSIVVVVAMQVTRWWSRRRIKQGQV